MLRQFHLATGTEMMIARVDSIARRPSCVCSAHVHRWSGSSARTVRCRAKESPSEASSEVDTASTSAADKPRVSLPKVELNISEPDVNVKKEINKFASTFAPRASGATKNPAYKGSLLYNIFGYQAWISLVVGGLLSYNVIFPSDQPDIARLMGMWSVWMFTIPSLRARECSSAEKDALNILFLAVPILNVLLPFVWKSFAFVYTADVVTLAGVLYWKMGMGQERTERSS